MTIHSFSDLVATTTGAAGVGEVMTKTSAQKHSEREALIEQGRREGAELAHQTMMKQSADLAILQGQVAMTVARAEALRIKESVAKGLCFRCHTHAANPLNDYHLCRVCGG